MIRLLAAACLLLTGSAAADNSAGNCPSDSFVDPGAAPLAPASVAELPFARWSRTLTLRDLVAQIGPAAEEIDVPGEWHRLRWAVADGTSLLVSPELPCAPIQRMLLTGVGAGDAEPGSPEAVVRALYRWIIVFGSVKEVDWSATVSGLVARPFLRAMAAERKAYRACNDWQESQLPLALKWERWRDDLARDPDQPTYVDMVLEPRGRFLSHLYPIGATGFTTTLHGPRLDVASVAVTLVENDIGWTDEVLLKHEQGQWRVVEVVLHDPSRDHRTATQVLADRAREMAASCLCPPRGQCPAWK